MASLGYSPLLCRDMETPLSMYTGAWNRHPYLSQECSGKILRLYMGSSCCKVLLLGWYGVLIEATALYHGRQGDTPNWQLALTIWRRRGGGGGGIMASMAVAIATACFSYYPHLSFSCSLRLFCSYMCILIHRAVTA